MKTTKEMIEVMQAFERGEKIEAFYNDVWVDIDIPEWSWGLRDYRVKPKEKKVYVPFDTAEEFLAAQRVHGSGVKVNSIDDSSFYAITGKNNVELSAFVNADGGVSLIAKSYRATMVYELLGLEVEFADGTPCGKEVELCQI